MFVQELGEEADDAAVDERHDEGRPADAGKAPEEAERQHDAEDKKAQVKARFEGGEPDAVLHGNGLDKEVVDLRIQVGLEKQVFWSLNPTAYRL